MAIRANKLNLSLQRLGNGPFTGPSHNGMGPSSYSHNYHTLLHFNILQDLSRGLYSNCITEAVEVNLLCSTAKENTAGNCLLHAIIYTSPGTV